LTTFPYCLGILPFFRYRLSQVLPPLPSGTDCCQLNKILIKFSLLSWGPLLCTCKLYRGCKSTFIARVNPCCQLQSMFSFHHITREVRLRVKESHLPCLTGYVGVFLTAEHESRPALPVCQLCNSRSITYVSGSQDYGQL